MLDRYLIRYFVTVVDQGNFSRAAVHCNVSQPTLSVGIAKLERIVGQTLFVRSNQRVELTGAGTRFLIHARRIEREFNHAFYAMGLAESLPPLRMGILSSIPSQIVASAVQKAQPQKENRFELVFGTERELTSHLAKGRIDLALTLVERGSERFTEHKIVTEGYALAVAASHPLAAHKQVAAEELIDNVMIVRRHCEALSETSRFFTERGIRPHFPLKTTDDERVMLMVAAGLGITVMPRCYAFAGVARPDLIGFDIVRSIGWVATADNVALIADPPAIVSALGQALLESVDNRL